MEKIILKNSEHKRNYNLLGQFSVLYIEDELNLFKHTSNILSDFVKKVYGALNTKEAYNIINNENIDAIISDIMLKDENSLDFLRHMRFNLEMETPIILTSVFSNINIMLDAIKLNAESYIVKPINAKNLLNCLYDALLPKIQQEEIKNFHNTVKTVTMLTNNKHMEVVLFIINNLDEYSVLNRSYEDVANHINADKSTVGNIFRQLLDNGILVKLRNKKYFFDKSKLQ
ncbi:MAG: response regulator [Campylobacteraceae bacterium]|nr:response regulator [Campylobacteraceae bacterium]